MSADINGPTEHTEKFKMNQNLQLTWHIVKKDVRRMGPTAAVWLALVAAVALIVRLAAIPNDVALSGFVQSWIDSMRLLQGCLAGASAVLAVLLVAQLVQEDGLIGEEAMWLTRPIGPGRLLAAKLLGAAVMLIAAPLAVMGPIWLASGFSVSELAGATLSVAVGQAVMIVFAGSVAALTRDLGKFVFGLVGLTVLLVMRVAFAAERGVTADVLETRMVILQVMVPVVVVAAGAMQYLTRKTRWARVMLGGGLAVAVAASLWWPWGTLAGRVGILGNWPRGSAAAVAQSVKIERMVVPAEASATRTIYWQTEALAAADEFVLIFNGGAQRVGAAGTMIRASIEPGRWWGEMAAKRVLSLVPNTGPLTTAMELRQLTPGEWCAVDAGGALTGEVRLARVKASVMGEWAWRVGASAWVGSSFTRVVSVPERNEGAQGVVRVEEREALPGGLLTVWSQGRGDGAVRRDYFALVNRRLGIFQTMRVVENGAMQSNGMLLAERSLEYDVPTGVAEDWMRDAVIVKVRFDVRERWTKTLTGERVGTTEREKTL
jgi:hypothetical protein